MQCPTRDIDCSMPCSRSLFWNILLVYWKPLSEWKIGLASGLSLRALSYVSNTSLLSFLPLMTYATGNRSYRSMMTLRYSFLPVSGTLNSVTSVAHFSLGFVALNSLFSLFSAAYYKWLHRTIPEQESENTKLAELIKEYDERFGHILGYRRMTSWINHFNHTSYSKNRVHRIMKKMGIHSIIRKKKKKYQSSRPETTAENKLKREFLHFF